MATEMTVQTERDVIKSVRKRWLEQYSTSPDDRKIGRPGKEETIKTIRDRLNALDLETCSVADVDKAIGVTGWAENECDFCDGQKDRVLYMGQGPDYESRWVSVCPDCLTKAAAKLALTSG